MSAETRLADENEKKKQMNETLITMGDELRAMIEQAKFFAEEPGVKPHLQIKRSLKLAQEHLQTGFMWLRRAIDPTEYF